MSVSKRHGKEFNKDLLGVTDFNVDDHVNAHIIVDYAICSKCPHQDCVWGCPVQCYTLLDTPQKINFQFEDCTECGVCFLMCDQGSVKWNNPRGTFGIKYRYG